MKKLMISSIVISTLQFSLIAHAEEGINVYCDTAFSEYQHRIMVDDVVGIAQHRQGFLQIEQPSDSSELKQALAGQSNLGMNQSGCKTWISNQERQGLLARLHFGFDQHNLTSMGSKALSQLAGELKTNGSSITVDGHTDSTGAEGYNQALGLQRALTTSDGLIADGVEKNRLVIRSFGESEPIASNSTAEGRAKNRRSEIWASVNDAADLEN
ncbi:OmpA-like domain-containing protein [Vibrio crassostreae]|uniref:OmpA family protein n=1 Tax=Vibrio crassostreae TaxID=246167 RepID=UPI000F48CA1B|nr:OmpA family protein [Vibrio crassostreae]ROO50025.1 OmpA family protein [Vibrio crassostreae]TCT75918.1 OmpA family protein [Vibrio crassostreae]CAK1702459.1 OmpA-like domain-containing protein [Vibrio crassostreae]CAK1712429.1 OmpA-like domain-containing protein [Vibrio crassostreae]CAK1757023.1 OmpA-like domain-containing protein [Vibrio crassostreae]